MRSFLFGRSDRTRTCGILLPKQTRYQLRHTPKYENQFSVPLKAHNIFIIYEKKAFVKNKIFFVGKIFKKILKNFQKGIDISKQIVYND